jgi:hypothetical protein
MIIMESRKHEGRYLRCMVLVNCLQKGILKGDTNLKIASDSKNANLKAT